MIDEVRSTLSRAPGMHDVRIWVALHFAVDPAANRGDKAGYAARKRYSNNVQ
jgi:hypothetical protein